MNEEFVGETKAQIKSLYKNQDEMKRDIDRIEISNESLKEMTAILKEQQRQSQQWFEAAQKQFDDNHKSMELMNQNLIELNGTVKNLQKDMDNVKVEVTELKESGKFDIRAFIKTQLPIILGGLILAGLSFWFGWSK